MVDVIKRKVVTFRWFCADKNRCEQIDEQIEQLVYHASKLSSYVERMEITGLECLVIEGKLKFALELLKRDRKTLWRRIRREVEEEIEVMSDKEEADHGLR